MAAAHVGSAGGQGRRPAQGWWIRGLARARAHPHTYPICGLQNTDAPTCRLGSSQNTRVPTCRLGLSQCESSWKGAW